MASIFSRIVAGEIPSVKIYEDATTLAFLDIGPASHGHTLVIAKEEYPDIYSIPLALLHDVHTVTQRVALAIRAALKPDGLNIIQNNGAAAGQTVFHYHVHIIPRWDGDTAIPIWRPGKTDTAALQAIATEIQAALGKA